MNSSAMINFLTEKVSGCQQRIPLFALAVLIVRMVILVIRNLLGIAFGSIRFLSSVLSWLSVLTILAILVLGVYFILLYMKKRQPLTLAAGILLIIYLLFSGSIFIKYLIYYAAFICIAIPFLSSSNENQRNFVLLVLGTSVVSLLAQLVSVRGIRLYFFWSFLVSLVQLVHILCVVPSLLTVTEKGGSLRETVSSLSSKAKEGINTAQNAISPRMKAENIVENGNDAVLGDISVDVPTTRNATPYTNMPGDEYMEGLSSCVEENSPHNVSGRVQYKTVIAPVELVVTSKESYSKGVKSYAAIIDQESVGGWRLDSIQKMVVTKKAGCIPTLMGMGSQTVRCNMLIFIKED